MKLTKILDRANLELRFKSCAEAKRNAELNGDLHSALAMRDTIDELLDDFLKAQAAALP